MNITINDKEYELNFGIGFLRELDNLAGIKSQGVSMGMGLTMTIPALEGYDPLALINVIYAGTHATSPRPSMEDVENYLNSFKTDKEIEKTYSDVMKELKKSPLVRFTINRLTTNK